MRNSILTCLCCLLFAGTTNAQTRIGLYGGYLDYPGISLEQYVTPRYSVELGTSFKTKLGMVYYGDSIRGQRYNILFINAALMKDFAKKERHGFSAGVYLRYYQTHGFITNINEITQYQAYVADSLYHVRWQKEHKVSIGLQASYWYRFDSGLSFAVTLGIGGSPGFAYWRHRKYLELPDETALFGSNDFIGMFNHISGIGRLTIAYTFR